MVVIKKKLISLLQLNLLYILKYNQTNNTQYILFDNFPELELNIITNYLLNNDEIK